MVGGGGTCLERRGRCFRGCGGGRRGCWRCWTRWWGWWFCRPMWRWEPLHAQSGGGGHAAVAFVFAYVFEPQLPALRFRVLASWKRQIGDCRQVKSTFLRTRTIICGDRDCCRELSMSIPRTFASDWSTFARRPVPLSNAGSILASVRSVRAGWDGKHGLAARLGGILDLETQPHHQ